MCIGFCSPIHTIYHDDKRYKTDMSSYKLSIKVWLIMTKLHCSAIHCEYNQHSQCCRADIRVDGGRDAKVPHETRCASFREKSDKTTNCASSCANPNSTVKVACTASSCAYNCKGECSAKNVQIGGSGAYTSADTECNTFSNGGPCKTNCR